MPKMRATEARRRVTRLVRQGGVEQGIDPDRYVPPPIRWGGVRIRVTPGGRTYRFCWRCGQWDREGAVPTPTEVEKLARSAHTPRCWRRFDVDATGGR